MEITNEITIHAPAAVIFPLAAETERWPRILPHYRSVRQLAGDDQRKLVAMAAWRGFPPAPALLHWPVRWVAAQRNYPAEGRITFRHVRGITRGMAVVWTLTETPAGTRVRIWHEFHSGLPLIGAFFARRIVGQLFVGAIAGRTLRRIKELAEARAM